MSISTLFSFAGAANGANPHGNLTVSGDWLYGTTYKGGTYNHGTIFKMRSDGSDFSVLHHFHYNGIGTDGAYPLGSLVLDNGVLYGMTQRGGQSSTTNIYLGGTVFKINTDGTGYTVLHRFLGGVAGGAQPNDSLFLADDGYLYGFTPDCGYFGMTAFTNGTIFKISKAGSHSVIYTYAGNFKGTIPCSGGFGYISKLNGTPNVVGNIIYGLSYGDGQGWSSTPDNDDPSGCFFKINTDGTDFQVLRRYDGISNNITSPVGQPQQRSGYFYFMTQWGGTADNGTIIKIKQDGTEETVLHEFATYGSIYGSLYLARASTLFGTTYIGGTNNKGQLFSISGSLDDFCFYGITGSEIFRINTDGSNFVSIHSFSGEQPMDSLVAYIPPPEEDKRADGFVKDAALTGQQVRIYFEGLNEFKSGLEPGQMQFLSSDGQITIVPKTSGYGGISQIVGHATEDGKFWFHSYPIVKLWEG